MTRRAVTDIEVQDLNALRRLDPDVRRRIQQWTSECARGLQSRDWNERVRAACKMCDKALYLIFAWRKLSNVESKAYISAMSVPKGGRKTAAAALIHFAYDLIGLLDRQNVIEHD